MKQVTRWYSERLNSSSQLVRWGHFGVPLLLFPTAGGDAEEIERCALVQTLEPFVAGGKLKIYSVDSVAGRAWLTNENVAHCVYTQQQFDAYLRYEVVPAIRTDCLSGNIPMMTAGASIGAFNALLVTCRYPEIFRRAICMSGTYDLGHWLKGQWFDEFHHYSPLNFVPLIHDEQHLGHLRQAEIYLATGQGDYENPGETWKVAHVLGQQGIPNRVDLWGHEWKHDWHTWREMLPKYVEQILNDF
jgi:esterase/lipase superfamily enzyme